MYKRIFTILVTLHLLVWTLLPTIFRYTLPMDALEGFVWGQHWQLGYDRNPWLNGWLTSLAVQIGGHSGWLVYLLSQISVVLCFWAIWKLGNKFLAPVYSLCAVLLLEAIQYFTLAAVDFNDNVLELSLWSLMALSFYDAMKEQKLRDFILLGIFAGLAMMAKYYVVFLLAPMLLFMLIDKDARQSFKNVNFYLGSAVFLAIIAPHFIWLFQNHFATYQYAFARAFNTIESHTSPLYFFAMQILAFLLPLALFMFLLLGRNDQETLGSKQTLTSFNKKFLLLLGVGPLILTTLVALIMHMALHTMWGTPLLSMWGLILVAFTQPNITWPKFKRFLIAISTVFVLIAGGYVYGFFTPHNHSSANFPAKNISSHIMHTWHEVTNQKACFIVGDRYLAGNVAYFAKDKPYVYVINGGILNAKIDLNKMKQFGAILVWQSSLRTTGNTTSPPEMQKFIHTKLPNTQSSKIYSEGFSQLRGSKQKIWIHWLFLNTPKALPSP